MSVTNHWAICSSVARRSLDSGIYLGHCCLHQVSSWLSTHRTVLVNVLQSAYRKIQKYLAHLPPSHSHLKFVPLKVFPFSSFRLSNSPFLPKSSILVYLNFSLPLLRTSLLEVYIFCTFHFAKLSLFLWFLLFSVSLLCCWTLRPFGRICRKKCPEVTFTPLGLQKKNL